MSVHAVRLPDMGEGVAEAELVEWHVSVGDTVTTESVLAEVLTDKATVEISSPVAGVVVYVRGDPGEKVAVGSEFVGVETDGVATPAVAPTPTKAAAAEPVTAKPVAEKP